METSAVETWIYGKLAADTALTAVTDLRIYNTRRPTGAAFPCVVFQFTGGEDFTVLGAVRVWARLNYLVRGIAEGKSYEGSLKTIMDRLDAVLHGSSGTNASGVVYTCVRTQVYQLTEMVDGRDFKHLGSIFSIQAR